MYITRLLEVEFDGSGSFSAGMGKAVGNLFNFKMIYISILHSPLRHTQHCSTLGTYRELSLLVGSHGRCS